MRRQAVSPKVTAIPRQRDAAEKRNKKTDVAEHPQVFHHVYFLTGPLARQVAL
jgi:hypothetical protein